MNSKFLAYIFSFILLILPSQNIISFDKNISVGFQTPQNLSSLNSKSDDFAPTFNKFENRLYFNSTRTGYSRFYIASLDENDSILFADYKILRSPINEEKQNCSYISFIDEKNAVLSAFNTLKYGSFLSLHRTNIERNSWIKPIPIPDFIDTTFSAHPTISPNQKIMIFSSNREKVNKDTDLWIAYRQDDNTWGMFTPLDELNSTSNEITPCFVSDSVLIFASNGFDGPGGYDLYYSIATNNIWGKPIPINDINTEFNESDPAILPDGTIIFASDRPNGLGKLDLYAAKPKIKIEDKDLVKHNMTISTPVNDIYITKNTQYNLCSKHIENTSNFLKNETYFKAEPEAIQINIDFNYEFNPIELYCIFNSDDTINIDIKERKIIYELNKQETLFTKDNITVQVIAIDKEKNILNDTILFSISKKEKKELKRHLISNKNYFRSFLYAEYDKFNDFYSNNKELLEKLNNILPYTNKVVVLTNFNLNRDFYNELKKILQKKNIEFKNNTVELKEFNPKIIEIRSELPQ